MHLEIEVVKNCETLVNSKAPLDEKLQFSFRGVLDDFERLIFMFTQFQLDGTIVFDV